MGAPTFPASSSRPPQPHRETANYRRSNALHENSQTDKENLEATYTSLIQEYLQVMCLENATALAERMVASCQTPHAYYLLAVCHYRSGAPQRALAVLAKNSATKQDSATCYLTAKCCLDLQQYGRAEEAMLGGARADYKEYKTANRNPNAIHKETTNIMSMDEWLTETSPCPIPNGAAGLYLLGNICRRSNRRRRAMDYYRMSLQVC